MPELQDISVSYSRKVQFEKFEPIEHFVELGVTIEDGDDADEVYDEYSARAEDMVERAIASRTAEKVMGEEDADAE